MIRDTTLSFAKSSPWLRGRVCLTLCEIVNQSEESRRDSYRKMGLREIQFFRGSSSDKLFTDTELSVVVNNEIIFLVFRGSETSIKPLRNLYDWLNDFTISKARFSGTRVHRGIKRALMAVWPKLKKELSGWRGSRALWITGHSLGGALAQMAGYGLLEKGHPVKGIVAYGSPRVGGGNWLDKMQESGLFNRTELWINDKDPVARLPPSSERKYPRLKNLPLWAYSGYIHYINPEDKRVYFKYANAKKLKLITLAFDDHRTSSYRKQMDELMPPEVFGLFGLLMKNTPIIALRSLFGNSDKELSLRSWFETIGRRTATKSFRHYI